MSKDDKIRRLLIILGSLMVIVGGYMALTRGNPLDKEIGYVFATNGYQRIEVEGYKYSYNSGDNQSKVDKFKTVDQANDIPELDYILSDENCQIKLSYSKKYAGELSYTVYDENFNVIAENQPSLSMPGEVGKKYYIESSVNWGGKKKSVTIKYYFAINVKE